MGRYPVKGQPARRWPLPALLVLTAALLSGEPCSGTAPTSAVPTPVRIHGTAWRVGTEVELTLRTTPPLRSETISVTLLAPGTGQPQVADLASDSIGLSGVQLLWLPPAYREAEAALAAAAGARYMGLDFEWRRIEPERGRYVWDETDEVVSLAKRYGLRLVPMLLYTPLWASTAPYAALDYHRAPPVDVSDYRDFVHAVVKRYKPYGDSPLTQDGYGITSWAIWNEPNMRGHQEGPALGGSWNGSLEEYLLLLRAGFEGAHAADPDCNVLNGALADVFWEQGELDLVTALERFYDPNGDGDAADGGRPFFDTLNVHTYQIGAPDAAWYIQRLDAVLRVMERFGDGRKAIWITETGYGSVEMPVEGSPYVDEETQAEAVRMIYEVCSAYPQVERVFWWSLRDYYSDASDRNPAMEAHYGLLRASFAPKPAYFALGRLTGSLGEVLTLTSMTGAQGLATVTVPASFVVWPGRYVVLVNLEGTIVTTPFIFEATPAEEQE